MTHYVVVVCDELDPMEQILILMILNLHLIFIIVI